MGDKAYQHENLLYCVALVSYEIVKISRPLGSTINGPIKTSGVDYYKCPKAHVIMSKHPFFSLLLDILGQILQIFKLELLQISKKGMLGENDIPEDSLDVSFSTQVEHDVKAATSLPIMVPLVG